MVVYTTQGEYQINISEIVKPAFPVTSHDRPPILTGHIPRDGTVPSINHFPWLATSERCTLICVKIIEIDL